MDILIFTNFHPLLSSKMTKNAETAKICPNKAGHMETMAKNFIFEVKTVAKWLQKPKNRRAIFAGRGSWTWGSKSKRPQIQRLSPLCHGSITENPCWKSNLWTARPPFRRLCPRRVHFGWRKGFRQIDSGHVSGHFELFENNFFFRQISALAPSVCDSGGWQARSNCLWMYSTTSFRWHDGFLAVCPKTPFQGTILDAFRILTLSLFDSGGWHLRRRCSSMSSITYSRWQFDWYGAGRVTNGGIFLP